jgi:NAD(P)-dependent dehydrogenase (short-subunit alcohol dehydrogenase family)
MNMTLQNAVDKRVLDVTDEGQAIEVFTGIERDYGGIDILVNNAGISFGRNEVDQMDLSQFSETFNVNVVGTFICTKTAVPYMKKNKGGRIVNISSSSAFLRTRGAAAYSTSKVSISHLTRVWGNELAPYNINVNALCPSFVLTQMSEKTIDARAIAAVKRIELIKEETLKDFHLKRFIEIDEVANWVVLLCSEFSRSATGTNFSLSGGLAQL